MTKDQVIKKKAEWLVFCLSIGFQKSELDELSNIWDKYKDENGNLKPQSEIKEKTKEEYARETNIEKDKEIAEFKKQAEGWKAAFEILEYLIKIKDEKSPKDFRNLTNKIVKEIQTNL